MEINATSSTIWHYKASPLHALNFVLYTNSEPPWAAILVCSMHSECNPQPTDQRLYSCSNLYIAVVICSIQHILEALLSQLISSQISSCVNLYLCTVYTQDFPYRGVK